MIKEELMPDFKQHLVEIFYSSLKAVDPCNAVKKAIILADNNLSIDRLSYDLQEFERIVVVGAGKGTALMAQAIEELLQERIEEGIITVKYGHSRQLQKIRQVEASHPIPDEEGVRGTDEIVRLLEKADDRTLVICLLSGGGSALLVSPAEGLTLQDKQAATDLLLKSGASISELNAVRKHLSRVKGGWLARIAYPATVITLVLSDVIGDRLDVIASGPTVPDLSTFGDALEVVKKYSLRGKLPGNVVKYLDKGAEGETPDTPKAGEDCFKKGQIVVVGSLRQAINAARNTANKLGFDTEIVTDKLHGEAREAAAYLADLAKMVRTSKKGPKPLCLLSGGETTVNVTGTGLGGRNQEMALAFALGIEGIEGITMLSAGTDGTDGPTGATGAIVDGSTAGRARQIGLDPAEYLKNNDSYNFFNRVDYLTEEKGQLVTGPTGTNVMDMQIIAVE